MAALLIATVLTDSVAAGAAILAGLVALSTLVVKTYQMIRRIDEAIGVDKQGRTITERLESVEHQLWPNGGSSLNDQIYKISRRQSRLIEKIEDELGLEVKEDHE